MTAYRKPFSRNLYGKYDGVAKDKLIAHLVKGGHEVVDSTESYDADIVTQKDNTTYFSEAEVKTAWKGEWPTNWLEIRIPERKKRLLDKHAGTDLKFYIFSGDMSKAWCIDSKQLTEDKLKEATGRNIYNGEQFYHVPYKEAQLINVA
jgi:hypothetical protein|tara:strand:+ start:276 stop:719 length:444 start_codon:yes stop_codon:yes gene_type:complete